MPAADPFTLVLVTAPTSAVARRLARTLVIERLAACVNVIPGLRSIYRWDGKVCDDAEVLCLIKTRHALVDRLTGRVRDLHPYSVPEVIALPIAAGSAPYLAWLAASTRPKPLSTNAPPAGRARRATRRQPR